MSPFSLPMDRRNVRTSELVPAGESRSNPYDCARGSQATGERQRDAERTRAEILEVATREFAEQGFAGARVDEIADPHPHHQADDLLLLRRQGAALPGGARSRPTPTIREAEQTIEVDHLEPTAAIRRLAELTFDHHESHPDFIRLVSIENIHHAEHIAGLEDFAGQNSPVIELIERDPGPRPGAAASSRARSTPSTCTC